jgi:hypothetical protein
MKKILTIIMSIILLILVFTGCGNMSLGLGNFNYEKIHIDTYHYSGCFTIVKWYDGDAGIEVLTEEVGSIFLSEGTYMLLEGHKDCPFCEAKNK